MSDEAVVDVCPQVTERRTGRRLDAGHPFVARLNHRSHIVQIPRLSSRRRDDLEQLLSIFDQGLVSAGRQDNHVLSLEESAYPAEYGVVLRRLHRAVADGEVRRNMEGEDMLLRDSIISAQEAQRQQQRAQQAERRAARERQRAEQAEQREARLLAQSIRHLHGLGRRADEIAAALSVDAEPRGGFCRNDVRPRPPNAAGVIERLMRCANVVRRACCRAADTRKACESDTGLAVAEEHRPLRTTMDGLVGPPR